MRRRRRRPDQAQGATLTPSGLRSPGPSIGGTIDQMQLREFTELTMLAFLILMILQVACILGAGRLAAWKGRRPIAWMWSAALFGPFPLGVLALLPARRQGAAA